MKTVSTLFGKYHNPQTKDEYLVLEIKNYHHLIDQTDNSQRTLIKRRFETFDGRALTLIGGLHNPRFQIVETDTVLERANWVTH